MTSPLPESANRASGGLVGRISRFIGWAAVVCVVAACLFLIVMYRFIGDVTPFGEAVTVPPPIVWLAPLFVLFLPALLGRSWRALGLCLASVIVFLVAAEDWTSLLRSGNFTKEKQGLRVITWNIAGRSDWPALLGELEQWQPDLLFLQETPDGVASLTTESLTGYWNGFHWWDQGDCGILSRYELSLLESEKIGPWDKPAVAVTSYPTDGGTTSKVLLCNVRLMLPAAADALDRWISDPEVRHKTHKTRVAQYRDLATFIEGLKTQHETEKVILGGDFNCRGKSFSLAPLVDIGLRDIWGESGCGWGATVLAGFPVVRIDQVWVSAEWDSRQSRTWVGNVSDHQMVIADIAAGE